MLSDGDRIRNLLGTYCELIDRADYDGVAALFADDAVLTAEDGTVLAEGRAAIADHFRGMVTLHDASPRTKHIVADTVLAEEPGAAGGISARSSYVVLQATAALPLQPIICGRYVDRFLPGDGGDWRWVERRYAADLVGHLSHHLGRIG
jgi:3-phenylpropionate/cinnamic acid dioxygenase small subunit